MFKNIPGILVFVFVLLSSYSGAQLEFPEDKVSWKFTVEQKGDEATVIGTITMDQHWHIYAAHLPQGSFLIPTNVKLEASSNFKKVGKLEEPKPVFEHDELTDEDLYYHSNTIKLKQKIKVLSEEDFTIKGVFSFQTCDDSHCLPPYEAEFSVKLKGVEKGNSEEEQESGDAFSFVEEKGDEAKDDEGNSYVKVEGEWYKVPEGNSTGFYKKYIKLGGKHEE